MSCFVNTKEMFKLLYSTKFVNFYCVYECLFELREEISKNPELREIIRGLANESGFVYEYNGQFYAKLVSYWDSNYGVSDVLQAIQISIPCEFYIDILWNLYYYSLPKELTYFLISHEIENGEHTSVGVNYKQFTFVTLEQAKELKALAKSFNKTIEVFITRESFSNRLNMKTNNLNPCLHLFEYRLLELEHESMRGSLSDIIKSYTNTYVKYFKYRKKTPPFDPSYICKIYPYFHCFPELFIDRLEQNNLDKDSCDLLLEHIEEYLSLFNKES